MLLPGDASPAVREEVPGAAGKAPVGGGDMGAPCPPLLLPIERPLIAVVAPWPRAQGGCVALVGVDMLPLDDNPPGDARGPSEVCVCECVLALSLAWAAAAALKAPMRPGETGSAGGALLGVRILLSSVVSSEFAVEVCCAWFWFLDELPSDVGMAAPIAALARVF